MPRRIHKQSGFGQGEGKQLRSSPPIMIDLDLTYPKVVELLGGREESSFCDAAQRTSRGQRDRGSGRGRPQRSPAGDKRFAIVPMTVHIKVPALRASGFLLAVSTRRYWTFIDCRD